jgi:hypothetical protein
MAIRNGAPTYMLDSLIVHHEAQLDESPFTIDRVPSTPLDHK